MLWSGNVSNMNISQQYRNESGALLGVIVHVPTYSSRAPDKLIGVY